MIGGIGNWLKKRVDDVQGAFGVSNTAQTFKTNTPKAAPARTISRQPQPQQFSQPAQTNKITNDVNSVMQPRFNLNQSLQNNGVNTQPKVQQPKTTQQLVNDSYGSGFGGLVNRGKDLLDANTEADRIKRQAQSGLNETYEQQQTRLTNAATSAQSSRGVGQQGAASFGREAVDFIGKAPGAIGNIGGSIMQSKNPVVKTLRSAVPVLNAASIADAQTGGAGGRELQRMSNNANKFIDNKVGQSRFGERQGENKWAVGGGQVAAQLPLQIATGGAGVVSTGARMASDEYNKARAAGRSNDAALGIGLLQGGASALSEKIGVDRFLPGNNVAGSTLVRAAKRFLTEGTQEAQQQFTQNLITNKTYNPNQSLREGIGESFLLGGSVGGATSGLLDAPDVFNNRTPLNEGGYIAGPLAPDFSKAQAEGKVFEGVDGKPRFEVDDSGAKIKNPNGKTLGELLDHPKLFEQYDSLKNLPVKTFTDSDSRLSGAYDYENKSMELNLADRNPLGALLHELQHAVQDIEGTATGTSLYRAGEYRNKKLREHNSNLTTEETYKRQEKINQEVDAVKAARRKEGSPLSHDETTALYTKLRNKYFGRPSKYGKLTDFDVYERHAGEAEARAVEARMNMPMSERYVEPETLYHGTGKDFKQFGLNAETKQARADIAKLNAERNKLVDSGKVVDNALTIPPQAQKRIAQIDQEIQAIYQRPNIMPSNVKEKGVYLTSDKNYAKTFAGKDGKILETTADLKKPYIIKNQDEMDLIEDAAYYPDIIKGLEADGYDGIKAPDGQVLVFDPAKVKIGTPQPRSTFYDSLDVPKEDLIVRNEGGKAMSVDPLESLKQEARKLDEQVRSYDMKKNFKGFSESDDARQLVELEGKLQKQNELVSRLENPVDKVTVSQIESVGRKAILKGDVTKEQLVKQYAKMSKEKYPSNQKRYIDDVYGSPEAYFDDVIAKGEAGIVEQYSQFAEMSTSPKFEDFYNRTVLSRNKTGLNRNEPKLNKVERKITETEPKRTEKATQSQPPKAKPSPLESLKQEARKYETAKEFALVHSNEKQRLRLDDLSAVETSDKSVDWGFDQRKAPPIIVDQHGQILDGHHRYYAAKEAFEKDAKLYNEGKVNHTYMEQKWGDVNFGEIDAVVKNKENLGKGWAQEKKSDNLTYDQLTDLYNQAHTEAKTAAPKVEAPKSAPIEKTPQAGTPDPTTALKQEALKYKSAEEFVKAQGEPVYHGTTEKIQGDFRYPLYTTPKRDYAQVFADSTAASSIGKSGKKLSDAPMVHEFAVNPKARVLDITNPAHRKLLEEQYFGKYSMSYDPVVGKNGHIDWTEGENLAEWIDQNKLPFDAIKLDEGGGGFDPSSGLPVIDKGVSYMALNKNALRSKQQLTDLYNQAHAEAKVPTPQTPKPEAPDPTAAPKGAPIEKTPQVGKPDPLAALKQEANQLKTPRGNLQDALQPDTAYSDMLRGIEAQTQQPQVFDPELKKLERQKQQIIDAEARAKYEASKQLAQDQKDLRKTIRASGGIGSSDYETLPSGLKRKNGRALDDLATELGFESDQALVDELTTHTQPERLKDLREVVEHEMKNGKSELSGDYKNLLKAIDDRHAELLRYPDGARVIENKPNFPTLEEFNSLTSRPEAQDPSSKTRSSVAAATSDLRKQQFDAVIKGDLDTADQVRKKIGEIETGLKRTAPEVKREVETVQPVIKSIKDKAVREKFVAATKGYLGTKNSNKIERQVAIRDLENKYKLSEAEKLNAIQALDSSTVKPANDNVANYVKEFRSLTDSAYKQYRESGVNMGYQSSYLPRIYQNPETGQMYDSAEFELLQRGSKRMKGREADKVNTDWLVERDPTKLLERYYDSMDKVAAGQKYMKELQNAGLITASTEPVPGLRPIVAEGMQNESGMTYYAPKQVADKLNTMFGSKETTNLVEKVMEKGSGINSLFQGFVLSGGIPNTPVNSFGMMQVMKEAMTLHPVKAGRAIHAGFSKKFADKYFTSRKDMIKLMAENDVDIRIDLSETGKSGWQRTKEAWSDSKAKGLNRGWDEITNDSTFKRFMPMLEVVHFENMYKKAYKKTGDQAKAARIAADSVKNFYGKTGEYKQAVRSKLTNDAMGAALFAPRFRESMVNFWGKNIKALNPKNMTKLEYRDNVKFMAASAFTFAAMNALNEALNGVNMWDNPDDKKDKLIIPAEKLKQLGINTNGKDVGLPFLSSIATVPRNAISGAASFVTGDFESAGKRAKSFLSMPLSSAGDLIANEDYFGNRIVKDDVKGLDRFTQMGAYTAGRNMQPWLREGLNKFGTKLPDDLKKRLGVKEKGGFETAANALESPLRFYNPEYYKYGGKWAPRGDGVKFDSIAEQKAASQSQTNNTTGKSSRVKIADNLGSEYKKILTRYNDMSSEDREKLFFSENAAEYQYSLARYENDLAKGTLSVADKVVRKKSVAKAEVGSKFSKDTRESYDKLTKAELQNLTNNDPDGKRIWEDAVAYGDALVAAGIIKKNKLKTGSASGGSKKKGGSSRKGLVSNYKSSDTSAISKKLQQLAFGSSKSKSGSSAPKKHAAKLKGVRSA